MAQAHVHGFVEFGENILSNISFHTSDFIMIAASYSILNPDIINPLINV